MESPVIIAMCSKVGTANMADNCFYVIEHNGKPIVLDKINILDKLFYRNDEMFTLFTKKQSCVMKTTLMVKGWHVDVEFKMLIAPDSQNVEAFVKEFFGDETVTQVTTTDILCHVANDAISAIRENLAFVDVVRVPKASPVRNAERHAKLTELLKHKGIKLFVDELLLEAVY